MALSSVTMVNAQTRDSLAERTDFGGGNAWRTALRTSPAPDAPLVLADQPLIDVDGRERAEFSIRQLVALADAWSAWYRERGVRPRDRVAVWLDDTFEDQVHLTALAQLGAIAVLINGRVPVESAVSLIRRTSPVGIYTDERHRELLARHHDLGVGWTTTRADIGALTGTLAERDRYRHADTDPVAICHTSGTTGNPKPVVWAHRQSVAGVQYRMANHPEPPDALMLSAAPHSHSGAIAFTFYVLLAGVPLVAISDITGPGLARGIATHRPTAVLSFNQTLVEMLEAGADPADFDSVAVWISIGDSAHDAHNRALVKLGGATVDGERVPGSIVDDGLGSSELGWAALRHVVSADSPPKPRHLGTVVPIAEVAVLRPDGTRADTDEVGLLGVRSPSLAHGYWNDSDTTYRSQLSGYFLSGDLVYRDAEEHYYQVDRAVDAIRTARGDGYSILMEELVLLNLPEVADCAMVAGRHAGETVAVGVVRPREGSGDPADLLPRVNKVLAEAGQPELAVLEIARAETDIPLGATGKILKRVLREKYADLATYLPGRPAEVTATTLPVAAVPAAAEEDTTWITEASARTLAGRLGITLLSMSAEKVVGTMPVAGNEQLQGMLHGGASAALAESLGSLGAALHAGRGRLAVGVDINATHHRSVRDGVVTGTATALLLGRSSASYEVVITDEAGDRVCTARITCAVQTTGR
jgi:uncharacterized protein (TIGR00369 family)